MRLIALVALLITGVSAADPSPKLTREQQEKFLLEAKVIKTRSPKKGITGTLRATLSDGTITHDASIQTIDEQKARFEGAMGTEINFKDSFKFNIAAYRLALLLGIGNMMPPSVARKHKGDSAAFTWWVDDVMMDEGDRMKRKTQPPDSEDWNQQMFIVRVFDQLIYNTDRNLGNLLIDSQWRIWMIDHSRAFRLYEVIKEPKNLVKCDRAFLEKMKALNEAQCKKELEPYVNSMEIKGLLSRRDKIVAFFEKEGPSLLFDYKRKGE